jgi:hypothetical protein
MSIQRRILNPDQSYTFHSYFKMRFSDLPMPILYGAVTTGDSWVFGAFDRRARFPFREASPTVTEDLKIYRVPEDLESLVSILAGILTVV